MFVLANGGCSVVSNFATRPSEVSSWQYVIAALTRTLRACRFVAYRSALHLNPHMPLKA